MRSLARAVKDVAAFFVTIVVGIVVGTALFAVESVETLEMDVKKRIERRTHGK